jgi:multidrug resistance protein, MATE family
LFYITAMALVAFSVGMVIFSAVSGTGKTMVALRIEILCIAFYLITAFGLAVVFEAQAHMVWLVEVVYFSIMGLFSMIYLRIGNWKSMVV